MLAEPEEQVFLDARRHGIVLVRPLLRALVLALLGAAAFLGAPDGPPDPYALPALDTAVERLLQAVQQHETVAVYGDFDVDGVTSAAQLAEALSSLGAVPVVYIPDRFTEGAGDALGQAGLAHRMVSYPDAPHSFFDRTYKEHAAASEAAWGEVLAFIAANSVPA